MTNARAEVLEAAKQAAAVNDWSTARRILAPLVAMDPNGLPGFFLARAELELGRPESAASLVNAFRAQRPRHVGSAVLAARIHLATGELEQAEELARTVLELEPGNEAAPRLLERIGAAGRAPELAEEVAAVDAVFLEAGTDPASPELLRAVQGLRDLELVGDWVRDPAQAKIAYFRHARDLDVALRDYAPDLIDVATRFDHVAWPNRIREYLGESVLDVGCAPGGLVIGYLVAGASSYVGIDPAVELDSGRARNRRTRRWDDLGTTPRKIAERLPAVRVVPSAVEDHHFDSTFDTIVLQNVSEHLPDLDRVLSHLTSACHPGSHVVFLHHNFYSWNGHKRPQLVGQYADWGHVIALPNLPRDHELVANLNRLRLDELRETIDRHFAVVQWDEMPSDAATRRRLTPTVLDQVREAVPDVTPRELTVNNVFCVARPRGCAHTGTGTVTG